MTSAAALHILPHKRGSRRVQRQGDEHPPSEHDSETEAEADRAAAALGAGEIIVHDRYGRVHGAAPARR
jgi:hypothetical protein